MHWLTLLLSFQCKPDICYLCDCIHVDVGGHGHMTLPCVQSRETHCIQVVSYGIKVTFLVSVPNVWGMSNALVTPGFVAMNEVLVFSDLVREIYWCKFRLHTMLGFQVKKLQRVSGDCRRSISYLVVGVYRAWLLKLVGVVFSSVGNGSCSWRRYHGRPVSWSPWPVQRPQ